MPSMLENRLRKNLARLGPWAKRESIDAWRLYDLDVPEFPYSVDLYADQVLVTEFVTPRARRHSDEERALEHDAIVADVLAVTGVDAERLVFGDGYSVCRFNGIEYRECHGLVVCVG